MSLNREKCGLSSLLPMSCRERAEAFARHLHSRLTSLGTEDGIVTETTWLAAPESAITLSQPRHTNEENFYLEIDSPGSPNEELDKTELEKLINKENSYCNGQCSTSDLERTTKIHTQNDSDSDGPFYDTQSDFTTDLEKEIKPVNGIAKSFSDPELSQDEDSFLDCNSLNSLDYSDSELSKTDTNCNSINVEKKIPLIVTPKQLESSNSLHDDEDDDDTEERTPRVRRCSSLKTGKTPPGTPSRKKIVRFADVLGLDLADVRTFLDEIPKIPTSAYSDLQDADLKCESAPAALNICSVTVDKILIPLFQQPGGLPDFIDKIRENQVCLDSAVIKDPVTLCISGVARVKNLDFHKSVHIRYTLDSWESFADVPATYVENSCDGFSDKFSFMFYANNLEVGKKLEFAVRFQCKGCQYWDNNHGKNYCFQCLPATNTFRTPLADENWSTNFY